MNTTAQPQTPVNASHNIFIPCPDCIPGSNKTVGHSGPHVRSTPAQQQRRRRNDVRGANRRRVDTDTTPCPHCVPGSNKTVGHNSGPHVRSTRAQQRRRRNDVRRINRRRIDFGTVDIPLACRGTVDVPVHPTSAPDVGGMEHECNHCGALLFAGELTRHRFIYVYVYLLSFLNTVCLNVLCSKYGPFGLCCDNGRVRLKEFQQAPQSLWDLLTGFYKEKYLQCARQFNHAVAYASFKCWSETLPGPLSDMRIQGAAYVYTSGIRAEHFSHSKFIQVSV